MAVACRGEEKNAVPGDLQPATPRPLNVVRCLCVAVVLLLIAPAAVFKLAAPWALLVCAAAESIIIYSPGAASVLLLLPRDDTGCCTASQLRCVHTMT